MGILEFMSESPVLTCVILFIVCCGVEAAIKAFKGEG